MIFVAPSASGFFEHSALTKSANLCPEYVLCEGRTPVTASDAIDLARQISWDLDDHVMLEYAV